MFASLLLGLLIPTTTIDKDVEYAMPGGKAVLMDIYKPENSGLRPAIVVIHGGGWVAGDRGQMASTSAALADRGFVVANVAYRLAPANKWPAMIDDVQSAVRFIRTNAKKYNVDPDRIGAVGASAGGHLALMLGMSDTRDPAAPKSPSSKVSVVGNFFGVSDFTKMLPAWRVLGDTVFGVKGAGIEPAMKAASPLTYLDKGDAPVFTFHGDKDWVVPITQSKLLDEKLKAVGIEHVFRKIKDTGHQVDMTRKDVRDVVEEMTQWLEKKLRP
jgi:acetyl esterase/lipase